jgi:glycylpeptide N-tetradecanoyltransferase
LTPPNYHKDWLVGVRVTKNRRLVGFITGIPVHTQVQAEKLKMAEINFLCVHRSLRSKRLAPVLIKEVTRRVNLRGIWQAIYTAGVLIPTPISETRYYHRSLNPKKLIEIEFSRLPPNQTMARMVLLYKLPEAPTIALRPMKKSDISSMHALLKAYLRYHITPRRRVLMRLANSKFISHSQRKRSSTHSCHDQMLCRLMCCSTRRRRK